MSTEQRPFFEVLDALDSVLENANQPEPRRRAPIVALYGERGRYLRCIEIPSEPGRLVESSRRAFDGSPVYIQAHDVRHTTLYRESDSHGSGPRVLPKETPDADV